MFNKVLFPVVFTDQTEQMVGCLAGLSKSGVKEVLLFHVISISEIMEDRYANESYDEAMLEKWKSYLQDFGLKVEYKIVTGIPWIEIIDAAEKGNFSFILIGSHGSSFIDRLLLGSVAERVIQHAKVPVLIYKFKRDSVGGLVCQNIFERILFCTDFSSSSEKCIPYVENMLTNHNQRLIILHVQDLRNLRHVQPEKIEEFNRIDLERLDELKKHFERVGFKNVMTLLTTGYSISEILNYAATEDPTIIVVGKKGKTNLKEMLLGGVSQTLIQKSNKPVFLVE